MFLQLFESIHVDDGVVVRWSLYVSLLVSETPRADVRAM